MKLHVIATGSSGNCYLLEGADSALILEAGVPPESVFRSVRISTRKIAGVLITHEHGDHAKHVRRWLGLGFPVFMSAGTRAALRLEDAAAVEPVKAWEPSQIGAFLVRPFPAVHDAAEPLSFIIEHAESGRIVFATDTGRIDSGPGESDILSSRQITTIPSSTRTSAGVDCSRPLQNESGRIICPSTVAGRSSVNTTPPTSKRLF